MVVSERKIFKNGHLSSVKFQNFAVFSIFHHVPPLLVKILNTQPNHLIIILSPLFLIKITPLSSLSIELIKEKSIFCDFSKNFSHFSSKSPFFDSKNTFLQKNYF